MKPDWNSVKENGIPVHKVLEDNFFSFLVENKHGEKRWVEVIPEPDPDNPGKIRPRRCDSENEGISCICFDNREGHSPHIGSDGTMWITFPVINR